MTEDERYEIATLADALAEAQQRYKGLAETNQPSDPDKAREQTIAYYLAQSEMIEARNRLTSAQARLGMTPSP